MPRWNISLTRQIKRRADEIIRARGFAGPGLSDCVQTLIREEYERRSPPVVKPISSDETPEEKADKVLNAADARKKKPPGGSS